MPYDKTVVIWDTVDADIKFFVVNRDISHLNHKYVNSADNTEEEDMEISMLAYDKDSGAPIVEMLSEFPVAYVLAGAKVVVCGFLP